MHLLILKSGIKTFDALHAYGLGVVLACATNTTVQLDDDGISYILNVDDTSTLVENVWQTIMVLPSGSNAKTIQKQAHSNPLEEIALGNLDGILSTVFTSPGPRLISTADIIAKSKLDPDIWNKGIGKARKAIVRWQRLAIKKGRDEGMWIHDLLKVYQEKKEPMRVSSRKQGISIPMTLASELGFSSRLPLSDGRLSIKDNIFIENHPYAALLAIIGAARFLRSQRTGGKEVVLYIPLFSHINISPITTMPRLTSTKAFSAQARYMQQITYLESVNGELDAIHCQTLQTQGAQQSISIGSTYLGLRNLGRLHNLGNTILLNYWKTILSYPQEKHIFEIYLLIDALRIGTETAWRKHFLDYAWAIHNNKEHNLRRYNLSELRDVLTMSLPSTTPSLKPILNRKSGTLRFGHALRLLGRKNRGSYCEILEIMDRASQVDQLLHALGTLAQECELMAARDDFIIVPNDHDLICLLEDLEHHNVSVIRELIITLSALRYGKSESSSENATMSKNTVIE